MYAAAFLLSMLFALVEITLRSRGVFLPLLPCWLFYLAVVAGKKRSLFAAVLLGLLMDMLTNSAYPVHTASYLGAVCLGRFWLTGVDSDSLSAHALPGALLVLMVYVPASLLVSMQSFLRFLPYLFPLCMLGAILLPLMILSLDTLAEFCSFPLYADIKLQLRKGKIP